MPGGCTIESSHRPPHSRFGSYGAIADVVTSKQGKNACVALISGLLVSEQHKPLMAAALADGVTVIENAAREPEIVDLILLNEIE